MKKKTDNQDHVKQRAEVALPHVAQERFENAGGIPLDVVAELFALAKIGENSQAAFWRQAAQKELFYYTGKVVPIRTNRDGKTSIKLTNAAGKPQTWYHPNEITDEQLEEFKRAQDNDFEVETVGQGSPGWWILNSVQVNSKA
jgi:hypothetical protein